MRPGAASTTRSWRISPAHSENINFFGAIEADIEGELAELGRTGCWPLWVRDTLLRPKIGADW
ncbi:hypothetical protein ACQPZQ_16340 [Pseudonocardia sp. CA-142604]|uniref:hypothetical protein n=1 Tax=Pseudonocardia sp. CA-142604 TaxID=3240024 RepID=UPI003D8FEFF2